MLKKASECIAVQASTKSGWFFFSSGRVLAPESLGMIKDDDVVRSENAL